MFVNIDDDLVYQPRQSNHLGMEWRNQRVHFLIELCLETEFLIAVVVFLKGLPVHIVKLIEV